MAKRLIKLTLNNTYDEGQEREGVWGAIAEQAYEVEFKIKEINPDEYPDLEVIVEFRADYHSDIDLLIHYLNPIYVETLESA